MEKEKKYSIVTEELLERIKICINNMTLSFVPHDQEIIAGIKEFEAALKEINPEHVDDNTKNIIEEKTTTLINNKNSDYQYINNYILHGINLGLGILDGYIQSVKKRTKSIEK